MGKTICHLSSLPVSTTIVIILDFRRIVCLLVVYRQTNQNLFTHMYTTMAKYAYQDNRNEIFHLDFIIGCLHKRYLLIAKVSPLPITFLFALVHSLNTQPQNSPVI